VQLEPTPHTSHRGSSRASELRKTPPAGPAFRLYRNPRPRLRPLAHTRPPRAKMSNFGGFPCFRSAKRTARTAKARCTLHASPSASKGRGTNKFHGARLFKCFVFFQKMFENFGIFEVFFCFLFVFLARLLPCTSAPFRSKSANCTHPPSAKAHRTVRMPVPDFSGPVPDSRGLLFGRRSGFLGV